jgi:Ring finger domain
MECAVCYGDEGPFQKLCCGHTFCKGCIKNWYHKGAAGASCPMCRAPIYFKGFHKLRDEWAEEAWENRCSEILSEAIDNCIAETFEAAEYFPEEFREQITDGVLDDLRDLDKTMRFLKSEGVSSEDIEFVLFETMDYYSDRHIDKCWWIDEPPKEFATRYPVTEKSASRGFKRARAFEDPWVTVNFNMEFLLI